MKKVAPFLCLLVVPAAVFAACGAEPQAPKVPTPATATAQTSAEPTQAPEPEPLPPPKDDEVPEVPPAP